VCVCVCVCVGVRVCVVCSCVRRVVYCGVAVAVFIGAVVKRKF
jgi:hypothetical protein